MCICEGGASGNRGGADGAATAGGHPSPSPVAASIWKAAMTAITRSDYSPPLVNGLVAVAVAAAGLPRRVAPALPPPHHALVRSPPPDPHLAPIRLPRPRPHHTLTPPPLRQPP